MCVWGGGVPILIFCSKPAQRQIGNLNETGNVMVSEFDLFFLRARAKAVGVCVLCVGVSLAYLCTNA